MTDRYDTITVTLSEPVREDDLEVWLNAMRLMDKVDMVEPGKIDDLAKKRAKRELQNKLREGLR